MTRLTTAITNLSLLGNVFHSIPIVGERLECATRECSHICELVQKIVEHRKQYEDLALRVVQLLFAIAVTFKKLRPEPSQATIESNVDHLRQVLFDVILIVKDRASHQHEHRRITDVFFHHEFNPLCRLHHDKVDIPRLLRRMNEIVERFQVAPLMHTGGALAIAGINIGCIAQNIRLDEEDKRAHVDNASLLTLMPLHSAQWNALDTAISLELSSALADVFRMLCSWAQFPSGEAIFWLGAEIDSMGSGLARNFCQHLAYLDLLGASFFLDCPAQPAPEPRNVIHGIAYQLAVHDPAFSRAICAVLHKSPDLLSRPLQEQCTRLIVEPAATLQAKSPLFIVIDAFDMCVQDAEALDGEHLVRLLFNAVSKARGKFRLFITCHLSDATRKLLDELVASQHRTLFRSYIFRPFSPVHVTRTPSPPPVKSRVFNARRSLRAAVFAVVAIERMSMLLDYRAWLSPDKAFEHEHPPDSSSTMSPPRWSAEGLRGRDISLPAHECVLSKHLVPHLEDLMRSGVGVQTAVDILDRALLNAYPSHPAYGQGVRRLRRWCRKFALLPTSFKPISIRTIQLEPERPRYSTAVSDIFYGAHDGTGVAVKVLRAYTGEHSFADDQKSFRNEVVTWRYLRHPNIVPFLGVCDKSPLCLVSHWMEEGTLIDFFRRHPSERRTSYILGTIRGLAFMHSLGVVHGDIKAINVLVNREHCAQLADFGLASVLSTATTAITSTDANGKGTIRYMAPELCLNTSSVRTDRSDIYALSITIWETFTLDLPFSHIRDTFGLFLRVAKGDERPIKPNGCEKIGFTNDLWDVMQQGWSAQPEFRSSLSAFIEVLEGRN